jgi:hypothetical protein
MKTLAARAIHGRRVKSFFFVLTGRFAANGRAEA